MLYLTLYSTLKWNSTDDIYILFVEQSSNKLIDDICRTKTSAKQKETKLQEDPAAVRNLSEILFGGDNQQF